MSNDHPPAGQPEYLGAATYTEGASRQGRVWSRRGVAIGVAIGVVGAVAGGGWAALALMSDGAQPADAVPADALAYVSVDLDPSAGQKVEALRIAGKFPALRDELGLDAGDDLRRWLFDESGLAECADLDYDDDVAPWIGERAAFALLPGGNEPRPVVALAVDDEDRAASTLSGLEGCGPERSEVGVAVDEGYAVVAQTSQVARAALDAAARAPLADDPGFLEWTSAAGEPGIVTGYLAPGAPAAFSELADRMPRRGMDPRPGPGMGPWAGAGGGGLAALAQDFEGLGAVMRFADGTVEVEVATGGLPGGRGPGAEGLVSGVRDLPASTGAAFSAALPPGWLQDALEDLSRASGMPLAPLLAAAEARTGLSLPQDVETLLGEGASVVVDSDLEAGRALEREDLSGLRAGVRVLGDPEEITPVLDKLRRALPPSKAKLVVERGEGVVAFGFDADYVAALADTGQLGSEPRFRDAVPEAERSAASGFVDFDAGNGWFERLVADHARQAEGRDAEQVRGNIAPLDALGLSTWYDEGRQHGLLRLSTD